MNTTTPFFAGFHHLLFGRPSRSALEDLQDRRKALQEASLCQLAKLFEPWVRPEALAPKPGERRRHFPTAVTFWAFLSQVLNPGSPCRETLRKVQGWSAAHKLSLPDSNTGGYCKARQRLPEQTLRGIHQAGAERLQSGVGSSQLWCDRRVKVVDGTGLSMPDTAENQKAFPQPSTQKPGCGFPVIKLVGCFCLGSGALIDWAEGTLKNHEYVLFSKLFSCFVKGDVLLADRAFGSYEAIATLLAKGVDTVVRLHQGRKHDFRNGKRLSKNQRMVEWAKPKRRPPKTKAKVWNALPQCLSLRYVKIHVVTPGFRTQQIIVVTTLADVQRYTEEDLGELYFRRWRVELFFRDIKTTMGMDILRCQTPEMVRKEILMHAIVYNLIRAMMQEAADAFSIDLSRISFKGTVDTLRQWSEPLNAAASRHREFARLKEALLSLLAEDLLPLRPDRAEPRAKKRRPKNYQLLTAPRHEMRVAVSRKSK